MMLRSSSTPVLGSLLLSFSESPNINNHHHSEVNGGRNTQKVLCTNGGSPSLGKSLFHSPSVGDFKGKSSLSGFRRVQSEGNLEELVDNNIDEFNLCKKFARKPNNCCSLEAIHHLSSHDEEEEEEEEEEEDQESEMGDVGSLFKVENLLSEQERTNMTGYGILGLQDEGKMYLATGLGVTGITYADAGGIGGRGGGSQKPVGFGGDSGGGSQSMEEHYKRLLEGDPVNPLLLRNYARFLYKEKGDLERAEEYYSRAILADPKDGEILSQYAQLIWELHHDKDRADDYFERAIKASSEDSRIHAAYASFLWDTEDDEEEEQENAAGNSKAGPELLRIGVMASAATAY